MRILTEQLAAIGMGAFAFNDEFMNSQYEINLMHSDDSTRPTAHSA